MKAQGTQHNTPAHCKNSSRGDDCLFATGSSLPDEGGRENRLLCLFSPLLASQFDSRPVSQPVSIQWQNRSHTAAGLCLKNVFLSYSAVDHPSFHACFLALFAAQINLCPTPSIGITRVQGISPPLPPQSPLSFALSLLPRCC